MMGSQDVPRHVVFVTWKAGSAPTFEAAKRLGHEVTLIRSLQMERSQHIDFDATSYGQFVDSVYTLEDATLIEPLRECIREIHKRKRIDGFLATVDALVVPVAHIAAELGIPFTSAHGAETAKLKHKCRDALAGAGVDSTLHAVVADFDEARRFAEASGYPMVLKPAWGAASEGAHVIADEKRLREVFDQLEQDSHSYYAGILVEQYLTGKFVSAEIGLSHGKFVRLAVSERKTWDQHEALEVGTTIPAVISRQEYESVMKFAERVVNAVDLRLGIFHVEVMLGADGQPRLIELNPRIMGSCLPNLFRLAGGGDPFELLVRVYLNEDVDMGDVAFTGYATVRWFGAAQTEAKPESLPDLEWASDYGAALHSLTVRYPDTDMLMPCRGNLGNFGEVQVVHSDYKTSIRIAEEIVDRIATQLGIEVTG
jgi:biotin carboxylase